MRSWRGIAGLALSPSTPTPVEAAGPAVPFTPREKANPDSDLPPVPVSLDVVTARIGAPLGTVKEQIHHGRKLARPLLRGDA